MFILLLFVPVSKCVCVFITAVPITKLFVRVCLLLYCVVVCVCFIYSGSHCVCFTFEIQFVHNS